MKFFILLGSIFQIIAGISVGVEGKSQKCFFFDVYENQNIRVPFVVTGIHEEQSIIELFETVETDEGVKNITLDYIDQEKEGQLRYTSVYKKELNLCFTAFDSFYKIFSFDIDISGVDKNLADKTSMDETEGSLKQVLQKMHKVYRNQHFQIDRENYHEILMDSTENQVKWCALLKIIVLMSVCLIQIYMLTNFFKDKSFGPSV